MENANSAAEIAFANGLTPREWDTLKQMLRAPRTPQAVGGCAVGACGGCPFRRMCQGGAPAETTQTDTSRPDAQALYASNRPFYPEQPDLAFSDNSTEKTQKTNARATKKGKKKNHATANNVKPAHIRLLWRRASGS